MKISTLRLGFGLCGVTLGAIVWAQNAHPSAGGGPAPSASKAPAPAVRAATPAASVPGLKPMPFYASNHIREGMFAPPSPPPQAPPPPPPPAPPPPAPTPLPPPDPFAGFIYSGTVTIGDERMALIENQQTKAGEYLKVGDTFLGARVTQIEPEQILLQEGSALHVLPKSTALNLVPLSKSAAFLGGGQNGPGAPGGMPGAPMSDRVMVPLYNPPMMESLIRSQEMDSLIGQKLQLSFPAGGDIQILDFKSK